MNKESIIRRTLEPLTPGFIRLIIKRLYWGAIRIRDRHVYITKGKEAEIGYRFRFSRLDPYGAYIGNKTIIEEYNVWNANVGNINVGTGCWIGLNNIIMGPVQVGNNVTSGPRVAILGPRHPTLDPEAQKRETTIIGNNVWISTGSIINFGVVIGNNAIIGAGSVVTKDVMPGAFVSGNPARDLTKIVGKLWKMDTLVQERFRA